MSNETNHDKLIALLDEKKRSVKVENLSISIGELTSMYVDGELILRPEYQRLLKWSEKQKTIFLESLLLGLPTPSIFVSADDLGRWEIVDGLQRLSTIFDFLRGLDEKDTKFIPHYEPFKTLTDGMVYLDGEGENSDGFRGKSYADLPKKIQLELKRQRVNAVILQSGTSDDVKYELFQRVNEGGTPIKPMELRRAIMSHTNSSALESIEEVSEDAKFRCLFEESFLKDRSFNVLSSILYFLSFYKKHHDGDTQKVDNVDLYVTRYVRSLEESEFSKDLRTFSKTIDVINGLNLEDPSKVFVGTAGNSRYSDTIFGAITIGIAINIDNLPPKGTLKKLVQDISQNSDFKVFYKRGYPAAARIPKMLAFCQNYFSA